MMNFSDLEDRGIRVFISNDPKKWARYLVFRRGDLVIRRTLYGLEVESMTYGIMRDFAEDIMCREVLAEFNKAEQTIN